MSKGIVGTRPLKKSIQQLSDIGSRAKGLLFKLNPLKKDEAKEGKESDAAFIEAEVSTTTSVSKLSKYYDHLADKVIQSDQYNTVCQRGKVIVTMPKEYLDQLLTREKSIEEIDDSEEARLENAISELQKSDKVGTAGEVIVTAGGAAAGAAAAGTIASAAGATTLLGSTTLASLGGGIFVVSTPLGWVVGSAVVVGAAGYGIAKLIRSGGEQDHVRKNIVERLNRRLDVLRDRPDCCTVMEELQLLLPIAVGSSLVTESQADRMLELIGDNKLNPELALNRIKALQVKIQIHADCTQADI